MSKQFIGTLEVEDVLLSYWLGLLAPKAVSRQLLGNLLLVHANSTSKSRLRMNWNQNKVGKAFICFCITRAADIKCSRINVQIDIPQVTKNLSLLRFDGSRSQFQILDGLRQFRKFDVLDLLRDVHVLDGRDGPSWGSRQAGLEQKKLPEFRRTSLSSVRPNRTVNS